MRCRFVSCAGFGIIELGVVLMVLGMGFLLTLKGRALIAPMRAYVTAQQINQYRAAVLQYQTDRRALPGDDPTAPRRWRRPNALYNVTGGRLLSLAGDGRIDGRLDDGTSPLGEQYMAWADLRYGGYIGGDPELVGQSARPENIYGGVYAFAEANLGLDQVLCLTDVPGDDAGYLDRRMDDGNIATGGIRATSRWDPAEAGNIFPEPDSDGYDIEKTYIVCMPNMP